MTWADYAALLTVTIPPFVAGFFIGATAAYALGTEREL